MRRMGQLLHVGMHAGPSASHNEWWNRLAKDFRPGYTLVVPVGDPRPARRPHCKFSPHSCLYPGWRVAARAQWLRGCMFAITSLSGIYTTICFGPGARDKGLHGNEDKGRKGKQAAGPTYELLWGWSSMHGLGLHACFGGVATCGPKEAGLKKT